MKFRVVKEAPASVTCDLLAVPIYKDSKGSPAAAEIAALLGTTVKDLMASERMKGEIGECAVVPTFGRISAKKVAFVGVGDAKRSGAFEVRRAAAVVARRSNGSKTVGASLPSVNGNADVLARAFTEGFLLGSYRFERYKKPSDNAVKTSDVLITGVAPSAAVAKAIAKAEAVAMGTALARDLTNIPANDQSPVSLAQDARSIAKNLTGMTVKVMDEKQLAAKGMNGILGVGRGSPKPPRLIEIIYKAPGAKRSVAIIGKGITFDSGGINLKTQALDWMKMDMGGAAAVLGTMKAVGAIKPKVNVTGIVCSAENMPGGNALHPGDVLKMYGGQTVEIGNTDAEGRLVMADGLALAAQRSYDYILDIATLTGACMVALGPRCFGILGNDKDLVRGLLDAAATAGELAWELPVFDDYRKLIDSDIADMKNIGGQYGGAITAALFLREFVGNAKWAHLDIAGPTKSESDEYEQPKGATGAGVRTLVEWLTTL